MLNIWKKCDTCTLLFPDLPTLTMHKQSTHKKKGKSFNNAKISRKICKFCNYQVSNRSHLFHCLSHRYLIKLNRAGFTWCANKRVSFYKVLTILVLLHTDLWLMREDKSLLELVNMHLIKGDNKKTDISFLGIRFLRQILSLTEFLSDTLQQWGHKGLN